MNAVLNKYGLLPFEMIGRLGLGNNLVRRAVLSPLVENTQAVSDAIRYLDNTTLADLDASDSANCAPVFVLSAGWGSGSTLVQRLIISSGKYLVWGEPLDEAAPVQRMAQSLAAIRDGFPPSAQYSDNYDPVELSRAWIANLVPQLDCFREAHRRFFETWLDHGKANSNYENWGFKEVRLTIDHAIYLKWLYPNARFVFVYRDLYKCYLSCRGKPWMSIWPKHKATPIVSFAHHWNHLLTGFLERHREVDGLLIKYEDLVSGGFSIDELSQYLDIDNIDITLLDNKVGGRSANRHPLIFPERIILDSVAGRLRRRLGYLE